MIAAGAGGLVNGVVSSSRIKKESGVLPLLGCMEAGFIRSVQASELCWDFLTKPIVYYVTCAG